MKLLRLTSEDKTGLFDNDFSTSEIKIKKGDKLALQSASFSNIENVINSFFISRPFLHIHNQ